DRTRDARQPEVRLQGGDAGLHVQKGGRRAAQERRRTAPLDPVQIEPFAIERFYERWEFSAELMLSSSDCESRAVADLLALEPDAERRLLELRLGYTEVPGSAELRAAIAGRYEHVEPADVLALAAAEAG